MFCISCGTQLPDSANFCLNCGKPQKTDIRSTSTRNEVCTVQYRVVKGKGFLNPGTCRWEAIIEDEAGEHSIAHSPEFCAERLRSGEYATYESHIPLASKYQAEIQKKLLADGWELVEKGHHRVVYKRPV